MTHRNNVRAAHKTQLHFLQCSYSLMERSEKQTKRRFGNAISVITKLRQQFGC
jgi:hypothetical protein